MGGGPVACSLLSNVLVCLQVRVWVGSGERKTAEPSGCSLKQLQDHTHGPALLRPLPRALPF
jgi:hypothetical protein